MLPVGQNIVIVGGGSIGLAIAYQAANQASRASVIVIDDNKPNAASRTAGAMLGCFGEVTKYTFGHKAAEAKFDLMHAAHKRWPSWLAEIEETAGGSVAKSSGTHVILNPCGGPLDEQNFQAINSALQAYGEPHDIVDPRDITGLNPQGCARPLRAVYMPTEDAIDAEQYLNMLRMACERRGVQFIHEYVQPQSIRQRGASYELQVGKMTLACDALILAAGAWTTPLIAGSGLPVRIMPVFASVSTAMVASRRKGQAFVNAVRTPNRAGLRALYAMPLEGNREYIGSTSIPHADPQERINVGLSHFLAGSAMEQLSREFYSSSIESWRVGNRPVPLDTLPLIGSTSLPGLYVATGAYRDGFQASPVIADSIVGQVAGRESVVSMCFEPERQPISLMSVAESIDEVVLQEISVNQETGARLPDYHQNDDLVSEGARVAAEQVYRALGDSFGLHPDIVLALTDYVAADDLIAMVRTYL